MTRKQAAARIAKLRAEIREHDHLYYVEDRPRVSDEAYDKLYRELKALEERFPELVTADSPTQRVAGAPREGFETVEHLAPMLSLDSDQTEESLRRFDERVRKMLGDVEPTYVVEPKLDGASVELVYEEGRLTRAATRGDGRRGEGILDNVKTIRAVPLGLRGKRVPHLLSVRGEVIMWVDAFEKLNERLMEQGRDPFANPRNAAAGALRQLDARLTAERPLDIFVYDLLHLDGKAPASQWGVLSALGDWGFKVNDLPRRVASVEEILDFHADLLERRDDVGYEMDGVVIKLDDLASRRRFGATSHHPRWAFAFKFPPRKEVTRVLKIVPSVGRTGAVTPIAMMRPVEISGVTVSRASLHNREEVTRKDIRDGDLVRVQRAGDVIPQVVERIAEKGKRRKRRFKMPAECPSCGTELIERGPFTVCPNVFGCPAQLVGRLFHLGSRRALDIEGLGEETARTLVSEGLVERLPDLFDLEAEQLVELEGFAEISANNLVEAIGRSSNAELHRFLLGLGIPEVGVAVARDLARHFRSFEAIRAADEEALIEVEGIGPKMAEQITAFFEEEHNAELLDALLERVTLREPEADAASDALAGKRFVFTGGLETISREEAKELVAAHGGKVTGSLSAKTDYVVVGANPGAKADKAKKLELEILDEQAFLALVRP